MARDIVVERRALLDAGSDFVRALGLNPQHVGAVKVEVSPAPVVTCEVLVLGEDGKPKRPYETETLTVRSRG